MNTIRVALLFLRVGVMNDLHYRINFLIQLLQSLIQLGTGLVALWLIFSHTATLDGWQPSELLVVMGVYTTMGGLINAVVQPNMQRLMQEIQDGTFDFALTKPADAQMLASVREVQVWQGVDVITGLIVTLVAIAHLQTRIGLGEALSFLLVVVLGGTMLYCFWLVLTTAAFWIVKMDQLAELFQGVYAAGRYPVGVYPAWLRLGLTFLVPVAFAVTVPSEALTGRLDWQTLAGAAALCLIFVAFTRVFWRLGLRRYSGASA